MIQERKYRLRKMILIISLLITLGIAGFNLSNALAQTSESTWTDPVNLSNSGSTTNPQMMVDSKGNIHVLWEDTFHGYLYTFFDGNQWSEPVAVDLPFTAMTPKFVIGPNDQVHAFWISIEGNNLEGELLYSQVSASAMSNINSWTAPRTLADAAVAVDGAVDSQGVIHVGFIIPYQSEGLPSGTYYLRSNGIEWSEPESLYSSPYMRPLTINNSSIDVATSDNEETSNVFITWDNRPRQRIFMIKSASGGDTWNPIKEIVAPEVRTGISVPYNPLVNVNGDNIVLIWQVGQPDILCTQHYNLSIDGGETWGESDQMFKDIFGCPQNNQFITGYDDLTLLFTTIDERVYLLAWDGTQWSDPQPQPQLSSFTDPETLNDVIFGCRRASRVDENHLAIIGCDTNPFGDIWYLSRSIGDIADWFPPPSAWAAPSPLFDEGASSSYGRILFDTQNTTHVIWNQVNSIANQSSGIYYTFWNGSEWNTPTLISNSTSMVDKKPVAGVDSEDRLFVIWPGGQSGELRMSRAAADKASSPTEWEGPNEITPVHLTGQSPDIVTDGDGTILLAYAVPINEDRGIYLTISADDGDNWGKAIQVFDGAAAQWEIVDNPKITLGGLNYHVLWERTSLQGSKMVSDLYYSRSQDSGSTWSEPEIVTQEQVVQSDIIGLNEQIIHRVWVTDNSNLYSLSHQYSIDGGSTWSDATVLTGFDETVDAFNLIADESNRLHLAIISRKGTTLPALQHYIWDNSSWENEEGVEQVGNVIAPNSLDTAINNLGNFVVIYSEENQLEESHELSQLIMFTSRLITLPQHDPTPTSVITPTPILANDALGTATPMLTETAQPTATPLLTSSNTTSQNNGNSFFNRSWGGLMMGVILTGIMVVIIFGFRFGVQAYRNR